MAVDFRDWFRRQLELRNYSVSGFARLAGVPTATAQTWRRGAVPRWEQTAKIAEALNLPAEEVRRAAGYVDEDAEPAPERLSAASDEEELILRAWRVAEPPVRELLLAGARAIAEAAGEYSTGDHPQREQPSPRRAARGGR